MAQVSWAKSLKTHYIEVLAEQCLQRKQGREVSACPKHMTKPRSQVLGTCSSSLSPAHVWPYTISGLGKEPPENKGTG